MIETTVVYGLILFYVWLVFPLENLLFTLGGLAFVLALITLSSAFHGRTLKDVGLRRDNFYGSLRLVGAFTLACAAVLLLAGIFLKSICFNSLFVPDFLFYLLWAFLQQYTFQSFFNLKFSELFTKRFQTVVATAVVFSSVHFPNPFLMPVAFAAGIFWFWSFLKQPNLFTVSFSHALLGTLVRYTLPLSLTHNLNVGTLYSSLLLTMNITHRI